MEGASVEVGGAQLTIYDNVRRERAWGDLCRGPHIPSTKLIGNAFKLMRAAAYWRGSEKNPQLQHLRHGLGRSATSSRPTSERLAEAEKRDHRRLGAELDLFSFPDELGSGLAVFHPKGGIIKRDGGLRPPAPHRGGLPVRRRPTSPRTGCRHLRARFYYADTMLPAMEFEGTEYRLKAMNCPMHNLIYRSRGRPTASCRCGSSSSARSTASRSRAWCTA